MRMCSRIRAAIPSAPNQRISIHSFSARKRLPSWIPYSLKLCEPPVSGVRRYSGTRLNASRNASGRRKSRSEASNGVNIHLCGFTTIESARSHPANSPRCSGASAAAPP